MNNKHVCECGCGGEPKQGHFLPGHDQILRRRIDKRIGGLLRLKEIIYAIYPETGDQDPVHGKWRAA